MFMCASHLWQSCIFSFPWSIMRLFYRALLVPQRSIKDRNRNWVIVRTLLMMAHMPAATSSGSPAAPAPKPPTAPVPNPHTSVRLPDTRQTHRRSLPRCTCISPASCSFLEGLLRGSNISYFTPRVEKYIIGVPWWKIFCPSERRTENNIDDRRGNTKVFTSLRSRTGSRALPG